MSAAACDRLDDSPKRPRSSRMAMRADERLNGFYDSIAVRGFQCLRERGGEPDLFLREPEVGAQRGLVLIFRPDPETVSQIVSAVRELRDMGPALYAYPAADLHVTVLELIAAKPGFLCSEVLVKPYLDAVGEILREMPAFETVFRGLIPSESALLARGFPNSGLEALRRALRDGLAARGFAPVERYETVSCHVTAARFASAFTQRDKAAAQLDTLAELPFGRTVVRELELVCQNCLGAQREVLGRYALQ